MSQTSQAPELNEGGSLVNSSPPLNQILYGPPGTGKTFATINRALEILDPEFLRSNTSNRQALKQRFDELTKRGRIQFVTFHQSFSYEDFVEGLRADIDEKTKQLTYKVADGVFKKLCLSASTKVIQQATTPIELNGHQIWKMSLGNTLGAEAEIYEECINGDYILLGYGGRIDFSGCATRDDVTERFVSAGEIISDPKNDYRVTSVLSFVTKIKEGDFVVVSDGNLEFRAIGRVVGDYVFRPHPKRDGDYSQCRQVKWLQRYEPSQPYTALMAKRFSMMTLYQLTGSVDKDKFVALLEPQQENALTGSTGLDRYVLIIDEINRGNVSRIFGELITLIEPSKRAGAPESLEVKLPYSKEIPFSVPSNVYLIGTMNTADRSLAGLDIAMRRRFDFREMLPEPDLLKGVMINGIKIDELLTVINKRIEALLDREHCLGHAYFMPLKSDNRIELLAEIFRKKILPLLQEYFFEDWQHIRWVLNDHRKQKELQFVQQRYQDFQTLFGGKVQPAARTDSWKINNDAFNQAGAYLGIIHSVATSPVESESEESLLA